MFCSKLWHNFEFVDKPFVISNPLDLFDMLNYYYAVYQPKWFDSRNITWNRSSDPPFAQVLTSTLYGYTFNLIEMSKLLNEDE